MIWHRLLFPFIGFGLLASFALPPTSFAANSNDDVKEGSALYRDKGCGFCHGASGEGTKKAPAVNEIWKDKTWTPEKLTKQILDGGQKMPPFRESVTDQEASQLVAYLRAKNKPAPPASDESAPATPQQ